METLSPVQLPLRVVYDPGDERGERYLQQLAKVLRGWTPSGEDKPSGLPTLWLRSPHWPLRKILLVLRGNERDLQAASWAITLAHRSGAPATLLLVYPDAPGLYTRSSHVQLDLSMLIHLQDGVGGLLRHIVDEFGQKRIPCQLRMHKAEPGEQIRTELSQGQYDLVIISGEGHGRLWRWYFGELVHPLLSWIDRPVLVVA
jgi:nucleotide-binding universal stress UspA family protein